MVLASHIEKMCIVHTARYAGCAHVHSYTELVHEDAIYCPNQQAIYDGVSTEQEKCPGCVKQDQELRRAMSEPVVRSGADVRSSSCGSVTGSDDRASGLEFVEDWFGSGAGEEEWTRSSFRVRQNSLAESVEDWQLVDEADLAGYGERREEVEGVVRGFGFGSEDVEMMSSGPVLLRDADGRGDRQ